MTRSTVRIALCLLAGAALIVSCSDSTSPGGGGGGGGGGNAHPVGHTPTFALLDNGPWGAAISSTGLAYMTRPLTDSVSAINLTGPAVAASFAVGNRPDDIVFNASGSQAYVTNLDDQTVGVINTTTGVQTGTYNVPGQPFRILVGPGGTNLYVTLASGSVQVLNAATGDSVASIAVGATPNGMALDQTTGMLYVSGASSGSITEINTSTNAFSRNIPVGGNPQDIALVHATHKLYIANQANAFQTYDLTAATITTVLVDDAFGLAITPDATEAWVTEPRDGKITIIKLATGAVSDTIGSIGQPRHLAFSPDGKTAMIANEVGSVVVVK